MKNPIAHISIHAALGEAVVALVRDSGVLKKARRRTRKKKAKRTAAAKTPKPPKTGKRTMPAAVPATE